MLDSARHVRAPVYHRLWAGWFCKGSGICTWGVSGGVAACVCVMRCLTVSLPPPATPLQPVRLDTGAPIASTRVTVTTEPSAAPTMGSAGAAPAGLDSTAHSVSLCPPTPTHTHPSSLLSRRTLSSAGRLVELQQKVAEIFLSFFFFVRPKDRFGMCPFLFEASLSFFYLFEFCLSKEHF